MESAIIYHLYLVSTALRKVVAQIFFYLKGIFSPFLEPLKPIVFSPRQFSIFFFKNYTLKHEKVSVLSNAHEWIRGHVLRTKTTNSGAYSEFVDKNDVLNWRNCEFYKIILGMYFRSFINSEFSENCFLGLRGQKSEVRTQ